MEDLEIRKDLTIPGAELKMTTSRSGGPGGQHANKTSSRVTIDWHIDESGAVDDVGRRKIKARLPPSYVTDDGHILVSSDETRSQHRNRDDARDKLVALVRRALIEPKRRRKTKPSRASKRRRLDAKKRRGKLKTRRKKPADDD